MGLSGSVPLILAKRVGYGEQVASLDREFDDVHLFTRVSILLCPLPLDPHSTHQAIFSFCSWPFSLKLLWAPLVDAWWLPQLGRRKSWLVPVQVGQG